MIIASLELGQNLFITTAWMDKLNNGVPVRDWVLLKLVLDEAFSYLWMRVEVEDQVYHPLRIRHKILVKPEIVFLLFSIRLFNALLEQLKQGLIAAGVNDVLDSINFPLRDNSNLLLPDLLQIECALYELGIYVG
jgi:hypothetical protein